MSRAQGDGYRTHTDQALNDYREELRQRIISMQDSKEKWFKIGNNGWIHTEEKNRMINPRGSWKWQGWQVEAHEYWVTVYRGENVKIQDGKPKAIGIAEAREEWDDDKDAANKYFVEVAKPLAMGL